MQHATLALLLAACGGTNAPNGASTTTPAPAATTTPAPATTTTPAPATASPEPPAETVLRLAMAELTAVEDETDVYTLAADGLFSAMRDDLGFLTVPIARLSTKGELHRLDGSVGATVAQDGSVAFGASGKPSGMKIDENGVVTANGELVLAIGPDGAASGPRATRARLSYQGDAGARRALLFGMMASMSLLPKPAATVAPARPPVSTTIPACDTYRTAAGKAMSCDNFDAAWGDRVGNGIARVNSYATTPPIEGMEAAATSCVRATERIEAKLAATKCSP